MTDEIEVIDFITFIKLGGRHWGGTKLGVKNRQTVKKVALVFKQNQIYKIHVYFQHVLSRNHKNRLDYSSVLNSTISYCL